MVRLAAKTHLHLLLSLPPSFSLTDFSLPCSHRTEQEKDLCKADPMCDADQVHDQLHPVAEVLPNTILTIMLGVGIFYGYKLYSNPAVDTNARRVAL